MSDDDDALAALGYDPMWVRCGILSPDRLRAQHAELRAPGADPDTEHYRWATVRDHLAALTAIDDATLDALLALDRHEARIPSGFGSSIAHALLQRDDLSGPQLERVARAWRRPLRANIARRALELLLDVPEPSTPCTHSSLALEVPAGGVAVPCAACAPSPDAAELRQMLLAVSPDAWSPTR